VLLSQVLKTMASGAKGNKVLQSIGSESAARLHMVDLQVSWGTA
jgi:hypothetical protein